LDRRASDLLKTPDDMGRKKDILYAEIAEATQNLKYMQTRWMCGFSHPFMAERNFGDKFKYGKKWGK